MSIVTSREFNHDVSAAKREAGRGPVIITDHGRPSHVLLTFSDYQELTRSGVSLADAFTMVEDIDFEPVRPQDSIREVDL